MTNLPELAGDDLRRRIRELATADESARVGALTRGQIVRVTDQVVQPAYIWGKIDRGWIVLEPRLAPFAERLA